MNYLLIERLTIAGLMLAIAMAFQAPARLQDARDSLSSLSAITAIVAERVAR